MLKSLVVLFLLIILSLTPLNLFSEIAFYHFGQENGLNETNIKQIAQDSVGFIWLAGEFNLTRFDGHQFKEYKNDQGQKHPWNKIHNIYSDKDGRLWIGSDMGVSYYDFRKDEFIPVVEWNGTVINEFADGLNGKLWLATNLGLGCYDKNEKTYSWLSGKESNINPSRCNIPDTEVKHLCVQPDGKIWISLTPERLYLMDSQSYKASEFENPGGIAISQFDIGQLSFTGNKLYILCYKNGMISYNPQNDKIKRHETGIDNSGLKHFSFIGDSLAYLGTNNGLFRINLFNGNYLQYATIPGDILSIVRTPIDFFIIDTNKNLWCTSGTKGVNFGLNTPFRHFMFSETLAYNLSEKFVTAITFDNNNNLWMGYEAGLIEKHSYDPIMKTKFFLSSSSGNSTGTIMSIFADSKNRIWAGGWQSGLQKMNADGSGFSLAEIKTETQDTPNLDQADIRGISEDKYGNLWVSMHGIGLVKYNPESKIARIFGSDETHPQNGVSNPYVYNSTFEKIAFYGFPAPMD
ncbi:MAG TPA: two-component regulator propeller domain-containing protein [Draconibacterium sp.]|nr:two-component regulator propeller domain-containing protein [Draconibacterium sp.]